jgi:biotin-[acetyl-CoA-carboxylase] ligase BirA-like protein
MSQTSGRGQRGNTWLSEPGANLLFSIVLKFEGEDRQRRSAVPVVLAYDQFVISQIASLSVVDLLGAHDIQARIKWPNDIYVGNRKICGMLIENAVRGKWISSSIIGIGLNVNQRNFDVNLPNPTSMALCSLEKELSGTENHYTSSGSSSATSSVYQLDQLLEEFMDIFTEYIDRFCHITGGYNRLNKLYHAQLWRLDQPADFIDLTAGDTDFSSGTTDLPVGSISNESPLSPGGTPFRGTIRGTSPVGHLLIELPDGTTREFAFKEIAYVL